MDLVNHTIQVLQEGRIRTVRFGRHSRVCASRGSVIHMAVAIFENYSIYIESIYICLEF